MFRVPLPHAVLAGLYLASASCLIAASPESVRLSHDDFSAYRPGLFSSVVGAHTEYHYLPEAATKGNWAVSTFRSSVASQRAWRIVAHDGLAAMAQTYRNKFHHYHPMVVTGDPAWRDYRVTLRFIPQARDGQCGLVFRYRNDRCYYLATCAVRVATPISSSRTATATCGPSMTNYKIYGMPNATRGTTRMPMTSTTTARTN